MSNFKADFKRYFLTGLVSLLPLWLTLMLIWIVFSWISGFAVPVLTPLFRFIFAREQSVFLVRLTSFFLTIFFIYGTGLIATHLVGRKLLQRIENIFIKVPVMKNIYISVRKVISFFSTDKKAFKRVVLVEFTKPGVYQIGFITMEISGEIKEKLPENMVNVFIPTVPNPTTGFLVFVAQKDLIPLDMGIDEAFQMLFSGGILTPEKRSKNSVVV